MVTDGREKDLKVVAPNEGEAVVEVVQDHEPAPKMSERERTHGREQQDVSISETKTPQTAPVVAPRVSVPVQPKVKSDRLTKEIESILSEDFTDLYLAMPPGTQQAFKTKGEETASRIRELIRAAKINAKKIFQLIADWLKIIPGVNRFFLEQEAKIKTDKILLVSEEEKKRNETV